jgi:hypothetical protein
MQLVISGTERGEDGRTPFEAYRATTESLADKLGSLYEPYMNGLIEVDFDGDGNVVATREVNF